MYHPFISRYSISSIKYLYGIKNAANSGSISIILKTNYFSVFSHAWFATPQLVLHADWQEVWHSPHPPFFALSHKLRVSSVLILSIFNISI
jgi:hypothetical protein